ncbi:MAG TPA: hypothetical protein VFG59_06550 [Anaeromyxobacter sp.]|nr:hypothetical protein [Anaeromyxobacter sp.]
MERCALRQSIGMKAAMDVWQSFYCESNYERCERFKLYGAGSEVPARLLPTGRLLEGPDAMVAAVAKPAG